jgi:hypothetical protein
MDEITPQICTKCKESKPITEYSVYVDSRNSKSYTRKQCKQCRGRDLEKTKILRGNIKLLTEDEFNIALDMLERNVTAYELSKYIRCSYPAAKRYLENKSFYS